MIPYPDDSLPPFLIRKSDGATLYSTRDLAAIKYRRKKFKPYKIIYEVGVDQILHFKQLFWAAELFGWGKRDDYIHVVHGMTRLPTGRMRTRKGEMILLENVLKEAIKRARKIVEKKNPGLKQKEKEKIAEIVGIGAVKYNSLSRRPLTDIIFKWEDVLNLEGNSGPYLQYTYTRAKSIIGKSKIDTMKIKKGKSEFSFVPISGTAAGQPDSLTAVMAAGKEEKEIRLLKRLIKFPETIMESAKKYSPNLVCNYLFNLSQDFNAFYEAVPVLKEKRSDLKRRRLALVEATTQVIKNGLSLLGIEVLEKM